MAKNHRLLLIRNAFAYDFGGGERFPVHLARELTALGYHVAVVSHSQKLLHYAKLNAIHHIHGWWWSRQNWSGAYALLFPVYVLWQICLTVWYLQLIVRLKSDVIHPQSKDDFVAATLAGRLLGKRVIWTDHADLKYIFANHQIWYKNPVGKLVYLCSKLAHHITLVSESEGRLIESQLGHQLSKRYTVIYNGVHDQEITPSIPRRHDEIVFCATSRLVAAKGIGEVIGAFKKLRLTHPHAKLWLVGDGPERGVFVDLAKQETDIIFIGHSDDPLAYVASSDIFIHPSYHEGFSISLVEAAMLGKPVIACGVGGNPEIITDGVNGLLVPPKNAQALEVAMARLYQNATERTQYGKANRDIFVSQFNFPVIVKKGFVPLYENK